MSVRSKDCSYTKNKGHKSRNTNFGVYLNKSEQNPIVTVTVAATPVTLLSLF